MDENLYIDPKLDATRIRTWRMTIFTGPMARYTFYLRDTQANAHLTGWLLSREVGPYFWLALEVN